MNTEVINELFAGLTGLVVVAGGGYLVGTHPGDTAIVAGASSLVSTVITFYFVTRAARKATDGTITALGAMVDRSRAESEHTASTAASAAVQAVQTSQVPPIIKANGP